MEKKYLVKSGFRLAGPFNYNDVEQKLKIGHFKAIDEVCEAEGIWSYFKDHAHFKHLIESLEPHVVGLTDQTFSLTEEVSRHERHYEDLEPLKESPKKDRNWISILVFCVMGLVSFLIFKNFNGSELVSHEKEFSLVHYTINPTQNQFMLWKDTYKKDKKSSYQVDSVVLQALYSGYETESNLNSFLSLEDSERISKIFKSKTFFINRKYTDSNKALGELLKSDPENAAYLFNMALNFERLGEKTLAGEYLFKAGELSNYPLIVLKKLEWGLDVSTAEIIEMNSSREILFHKIYLMERNSKLVLAQDKEAFWKADSLQLDDYIQDPHFNLNLPKFISYDCGELGDQDIFIYCLMNQLKYPEVQKVLSQNDSSLTNKHWKKLLDFNLEKEDEFKVDESKEFKDAFYYFKEQSIESCFRSQNSKCAERAITKLLANKLDNMGVRLDKYKLMGESTQKIDLEKMNQELGSTHEYYKSFLQFRYNILESQK